MSIDVTNLSKTYVNRGAAPIQALAQFSLSVEPGKTVAVFGPNGCGKTTLLKICAGVLPSDNGVVAVKADGQSSQSIGYVPQDYSESLFPWLTILDNVAFPLRSRGVGGQASRDQVAERMKMLDVSLPLTHYPYECSAGQRQLAALLRALILSPAILLADEPFSALDYATKWQVALLFTRLVSSSAVSALVVTHDPEDAVFLGDRVVVVSGPPLAPVADFQVDLPRPRVPGVRDDARYAAFVTQTNKIASK